MKKPLIIYHKGCPDGIAAAALFYEHFGESAEYHQGVYQEKLPDVDDRDVYLLDFSYKSKVIDILITYANRLTIIDHHSSALDDLYPFALHPRVDMNFCSLNKSGAMLAWEYLKNCKYTKRKNIPHIIPYIQDRDLWEFKLPFSKELSMAISSYESTIEQYVKWLSLTKHDMKHLINDGKVIMRYYKNNLERTIAQTKHIATIGGYMVPVANVNALFASEAGNLMSEGCAFSATYYDISDARVFSLRSSKDGIDVSKVAVQYGGGGHPHAAGFKVKKPNLTL